MRRFFGYSLLINSAVLGFYLIDSSMTLAGENLVAKNLALTSAIGSSAHPSLVVAEVSTSKPLKSATPPLDTSNLPTPTAESLPTEVLAITVNEDQPLAQVTSVSQLSDVQPTDWAFQALQSLVERYGVIAGYPDGTFRGNRSLTRYEFAAGVNAALDRIQELISAGTTDLVRKEDLAILLKIAGRVRSRAECFAGASRYARSSHSGTRGQPVLDYHQVAWGSVGGSGECVRGRSR